MNFVRRPLFTGIILIAASIASWGQGKRKVIRKTVDRFRSPTLNLCPCNLYPDAFTWRV